MQQLQFQNGVLHVNFFLQLATQCLLRCKLQEKLPRVTWPLVFHQYMLHHFKTKTVKCLSSNWNIQRETFPKIKIENSVSFSTGAY